MGIYRKRKTSLDSKYSVRSYTEKNYTLNIYSKLLTTVSDIVLNRQKRVGWRCYRESKLPAVSLNKTKYINKFWK